MLAKKIAVLAAAAAISAPALADGASHGHGDGHGHGTLQACTDRGRAAPGRGSSLLPSGAAPGLRGPSPGAGVRAGTPVALYYYSRPEPVVPLLIGAVIGAAIVHHAVTATRRLLIEFGFEAGRRRVGEAPPPDHRLPAAVGRNEFRLPALRAPVDLFGIQ